MNKPLIYFAHPVNSYNTSLEEQLVSIIENSLPEYEVLNPNQQKHQIGYQIYKKQTGNGMAYYYSKVLPRTSAGIFLPFPDGTFGAGVGGEAKWFMEHNKPTYVISPGGLITMQEIELNKILDVPATIKRVYEYDYYGNHNDF